MGSMNVLVVRQLRLIPIVVMAACARPSPAAAPTPPGPGEGPLDLRQPHWDQPCVQDLSRPVALQLRDVLEDPERLAREVTALLPPVAPAPEAPRVNIAVTYGASGEVRTVHLARSTADSALAAEVLARVGPAVRRQPPLARPLFLQVSATRATRTPVLRLQPPELCVPHISHEEDQPPRLGEGARLFGGVSVFRPPGSTEPLPPTVSVRLHATASGAIELEVVRGDATLLPRVRAALAETVVDPALLNGEPAPGSVLLTFQFPEGGTRLEGETPREPAGAG